MEIKINNKANQRNLGLGTYGPIVKGFFRDKKVAVKKVPLGELSDDFTLAERALSQWDNPHVIKLLFVDEDAQFRYYAFEQCKNSLDQLIISEMRFKTPRYKILSCRKTANLRHKEGNIGNETAKTYNPEVSLPSTIPPRSPTSPFKDKLLLELDSIKQYRRSKLTLPMPIDENVLLQLAMGLEFIHQQGMVYGYIKPENILVDDGPPVTFKWADFGLTTLAIPNRDLPLAIRLSSHTGLWTWMAPELLKRIQATESESCSQRMTVASLGPTYASDIFSAGCLFFYIVTRGTHPFGDLNQTPMNIMRMEASNFEELPQEHTVRELIENMILEDPEWRIQLQRVIEVLTELADRREQEVNFLDLCSRSEMDDDDMLPLLRNYIDAGTDLNCADENGRTPLMLLYQCGNGKSRFKCTELLLGRKTEVQHTSPTVKSQAPCVQRCRRIKDHVSRRDRGVSPLKMVHANVNCSDNDGRNALMYLLTGNSRERIQETVKLFLWNGADINHEDENGTNVLMYLCSRYQGTDIVELARMLISYGVKLSHEDIAGDNALYYLLSNVADGRFPVIQEMVRLFICRGIDVNHENKSGQTVLLKLLWDSHPSTEVIKVLIQSGTRLDHQPKQGWDALFYLKKDYSEDEMKEILLAAKQVHFPS